MSQLANHWTITAFKDNIISHSELIVLIQLVSGNAKAISYGKLLVRSMSSKCELSVLEDELSSMQGVTIVRDAQRGVFVHVVKASIT